MGQATAEGFADVMRNYESQLSELEGKDLQAATVAETWADFRSRGRG
jgi:hypothetical protein